MPPGGFFDLESAALANALVGNRQDAPAIEIGLQSLRISVHAQATIAFVGAGCVIKRGGDKLPGQASYNFRSGDELEVVSSGPGCRLYLAVPGGADGRAGTQLVAGASIETGSLIPPIRLADPPSSLQSSEVRVVLGPQALQVSSPIPPIFKVSPLSNRVGVRIDGDGKVHDLELPSEPACPGVVQVTPNGQHIVLGPDGPTIGGYPKAFVVISADLDKVAQWRMGEDVRFRRVSIPESIEAGDERKAIINKKCREISLVLANYG